MLLTTRAPRPIERARIAPVEVPARGVAIARCICSLELLEAPRLEVDPPLDGWIVRTIEARAGYVLEIGVENLSDEPRTFAGWIAPQLHEDEGPRS